MKKKDFLTRYFEGKLSEVIDQYREECALAIDLADRRSDRSYLMQTIIGMRDDLEDAARIQAWGVLSLEMDDAKMFLVLSDLLNAKECMRLPDRLHYLCCAVEDAIVEGELGVIRVTVRDAENRRKRKKVYYYLVKGDVAVDEVEAHMAYRCGRTWKTVEIARANFRDFTHFNCFMDIFEQRHFIKDKFDPKEFEATMFSRQEDSRNLLGTSDSR